MKQISRINIKRNIIKDYFNKINQRTQNQIR